MTCIVGLVDSGSVWMGGDSLASSWYSCTTRKNPKVFKRGDFIFGTCGSVRMHQVLEHRFTPPERKPGQGIYRFLVTDFIDALREEFKDAGCAAKKDEVESGGCFLLGYQGKLFEVHSDYQVGQPESGYASVGAGDDLALGSLHTSGQYQIPPRKRIRLALLAAEEFSKSVRRPFKILKLGGPKAEQRPHFR